MTRVTSLVLILVLAAASAAAQPPRKARSVGADRDVAALTLVQSDRGRAVVRFASGALELIAPGDRVGKTAAVVKEIAAGRLVLEEDRRSADGRPLRTLIVIADGETGGKRYRAELEEKPPLAVRPIIVK